MSGCETKVPPLRFKGYPAGSAENADGGRVSSSTGGRARTSYPPSNASTEGGSMRGAVPWVRKPFCEFATLRRGLTYTPADCREKGVRVLRSSNIREETFILHDDDVFVSEQAANIPFAKNGDILITAANGSSHLVGKHALVDGVGKADTVHGGFMLLAESERPEFLDAAMSAAWYKRFIADNMMGGNGALGNLAKSSFDECVFFAPPTEAEQRDIGTFFRSLDALIAGREKALEKLEALKKSMLLKMFPQGDATVPEVRFKVFAGDWEKKRLGDMGTPYNGLSGKTKDDFGHGNGKYVTYMNVFSNAIADFVECDSVEVDKKQNEVRDGDVFFTTSSETPEEVGMSSVWIGEASNIYLNSFCFGYRPNPGNASEFLAYLFRSDRFRCAITYLAQGISRYNISKTKVMDLEVLLPDIEEQRKIGAYFRSLDALIAARREEAEKLKQMKKALLERMFV